MAYKHKITTSIPFDSTTPNIALDSVIDFITSTFIADNRQGPCGKNLVFFVTNECASFNVFKNKRRGEELHV